MTAVKLPEPTICGMACFYEPGHDGPHMRWLGADCDFQECKEKATWRWGRQVVCDEHLFQAKVKLQAKLEDRPEELVAKYQPIEEGSVGELLALREIVEIIMTMHWDLAACPCWVCDQGRAAGCRPRGVYQKLEGFEGRPKVHTDIPAENLEWRLR